MIYAKYCNNINVINQVVIHVIIARVAGLPAAVHLAPDVPPDCLLLQTTVHQTDSRTRGTCGQSSLSVCLICSAISSAGPQLRHYLR